MPRDGSNVYHIPPGTEGIPDTVIESAKYNTFIADVEQDFNLPRPILAGGTGATDAAGALAALSGEKAGQVVTNYDSHVFLSGSFSSATGATGAPGQPGHTFSGIVYLADANNIVVEARDSTDGKLYVRRKVGGVWNAWALEGDLSGVNADIDAVEVNVAALQTGKLNLAGNQTTTGGFRFTPFSLGTISSGTVTPNAMSGNYQTYTNNGAHNFAAPANGSAIDVLVTNGATAGAITFTGGFFGGTHGDPLTTTNGHAFLISVRNFTGQPMYVIKALQ